MHKNNSKRQRGFTLLQLVLTIIVIGIFASLIFIRYPESNVELSTLAQRLATDLRYMQNYAMTVHKNLRVNFSSGGYTLTESDGTTAVTQPAVGGNSITLPSGVTLSTTNLPSSYIVFNYKGEPYTDSSATTALTSNATVTLSKDGYTATVTIQAYTGAVLDPVTS